MRPKRKGRGIAGPEQRQVAYSSPAIEVEHGGHGGEGQGGAEGALLPRRDPALAEQTHERGVPIAAMARRAMIRRWEAREAPDEDEIDPGQGDHQHRQGRPYRGHERDDGAEKEEAYGGREEERRVGRLGDAGGGEEQGQRERQEQRKSGGFWGAALPGSNADYGGGENEEEGNGEGLAPIRFGYGGQAQQPETVGQEKRERAVPTRICARRRWLPQRGGLQGKAGSGNRRHRR